MRSDQRSNPTLQAAATAYRHMACICKYLANYPFQLPDPLLARSTPIPPGVNPCWWWIQLKHAGIQNCLTGKGLKWLHLVRNTLLTFSTPPYVSWERIAGGKCGRGSRERIWGGICWVGCLILFGIVAISSLC